MIDFYCDLNAGGMYHIFNKAVKNNLLFRTKGNYEFFLKRYDFYLSDLLETYCFCLLPNHFHLLVEIKDETIVKTAYRKYLEAREEERFQKSLDFGNPYIKKNIDEMVNKPVSDIISEQFRSLFISYSKSPFGDNQETGNLFRRPFKRLLVDNTKYFANLVHYIHTNSQKHNLNDDFRQYAWSSYNRILSGRPSKLQKDAVISWFNNKENYVQYHGISINIDEIKHLIIE